MMVLIFLLIKKKIIESWYKCMIQYRIRYEKFKYNVPNYKLKCKHMKFSCPSYYPYKLQ